nr:retrotransposon protein, putative, unclassified [Tanacetum cinerariifolium]
MVDFITASPLRIETTDEGTYILATVDGIQRTVSESSIRSNLKLRDEEGIVSIPDTELFENLTLMGYNISQNQKLTFQKDKHASPVRDVSKGEACPTKSGFIADQDRVTIAMSSTLPHDSAPRVTSLVADEGSMQHTISELTTLFLEDREGVAAKQSGDNAPIKGKSINEGEAAAERISNDSEDIARVLTSIDAATMDVKSAFLYGTIDEEVYVMQPPGFQEPAFPAKVYKVEKAMYGLHQAPRAWSSNTPMDKENP